MDREYRGKVLTLRKGSAGVSTEALRLFRIVMSNHGYLNGLKGLRSVCRTGCISLCAGAIILLPASCQKGQKIHDSADVLLEFGDSALTATAVNARIPAGLSPEDSTALFQKIVETWVEDMLLTDMAAERIDNLDEIEEKVAAYRRQLIIARYLRIVRDNSRRKADSDAVRSYFDAHSADMKLETPVVKGIYVKVPSNSDRLDDIRKWVRTATDVAVDNLEKYGLGQALQYDYFKDKWIDWQTISEAIPYRFENPEAFLSTLVAPSSNEKEKEGHQPPQGPARGFFETEFGGAVYMLHISAWLPSGSEMPYEFAATRIAAMLEEQDATESQRRLVASLYQRAKRDKMLRIISYDPGLDKKK